MFGTCYLSNSKSFSLLAVVTYIPKQGLLTTKNSESGSNPSQARATSLLFDIKYSVLKTYIKNNIILTKQFEFMGFLLYFIKFRQSHSGLGPCSNTHLLIEHCYILLHRC